MRPILLLFVSSVLLGAAPALEVVRAIVSQSDGGAAMPPGFQHVGGETLFFSCRIAGFAKTAEEKIHVAFSVQAFDAKGVALTEIYKNEMVEEVSPQDKEWQPKIVSEVQIPPLVAPGTYQIVVQVEDLIAHTKTESKVPFEVRGKTVDASDTLVVRNFHFYRGDEDALALEKAIYKGGDAVWTKFDITGFKYGEHNHIDVSYVASLLSPSGKVMWTQPDPAVDKDESFYAKRYVAAAMGINLLATTKAGEYTLMVTVTDNVGKQTVETKQTFTVE
jgi:hypothetical protein